MPDQIPCDAFNVKVEVGDYVRIFNGHRIGKIVKVFESGVAGMVQWNEEWTQYLWLGHIVKLEPEDLI